MAILEALACRLPCLITTACHFPELAAADGGIVVEPDARRRHARAARPARADARRARGGSGRTAGGWSSATTPGTSRPIAWPSVYDWLAGGGAPPECVIA